MKHARLIHLDNNYLTSLHDPVSTAKYQVVDWLWTGEKIGTSAVAWMEFLSGPKDGPRDATQITYTRRMLSGGITPFGEIEAEYAAYLFDRLGRPRSIKARLRMDCLIAACAISSNALLATGNVRDFQNFVHYGLELAVPS